MNTKKNKTQEKSKIVSKCFGQIMEDLGMFPYGHPIYTLKIKKA